MRFTACGLSGLVRFASLLALALNVGATISQRPLGGGSDDDGRQPVSVALFSSLERMSRLVDIAYCVGTTGVSEPFSCASRCIEFPTLVLAKTWNTGILMKDSCGYIAVDHGVRRPDTKEDERDLLGGKAIIIAFRGTYSIANTVVDLSTVPQEYLPYPSPDNGGETAKAPSHKCNNCTVHQGFLESWQQARKLVLPELEALKAQFPDYPVHLVGHSLGGAVAMLAALELRVSLGWDDLLVTTFGEPKVGNQPLCDYVDAVFALDTEAEAAGAADPEKRVYRRVTHVDDPVPLLPLTEWGYRSHGGEFFITKPDLSPSVEDVVVCRGASDDQCIAQGDVEVEQVEAVADEVVQQEEEEEEQEERLAGAVEGTAPQERRWVKRFPSVPARFKLWQLFFAHRDYFWRIGLCVPGGDPANWGREKYPDGQGGDDDARLEEL
ncbi:Lipase A like protein [Verticillium longisporum]|uniref:Lipase A like protein n=1 Tax=Verticillium longisporum TaxID=100787 RepID=A0A8I2ZT02_VERLO|nr:hypothetical protein VdG1_02957 [Verticillium dahliae VDG1]KAG7136988.1 Lipase A like protein [Verticillium longisporum]RBQ87445.1 hypothetical protein VDGD_03127 [Verticillium dahliae]